MVLNESTQVVLESAASYGYDQSFERVEAISERPNLLVFSAKHPESLRRSVQNHASYMSSHSGTLNDMSYTLSAKRQPLSYRAFCIASEGDPFEPSRMNRPGEAPSLIFTFTGQGAQWARMGKELFSQEALFSNSIKALDRVLSSLPEAPQWTLQGEKPSWSDCVPQLTGVSRRDSQTETTKPALRSTIFPAMLHCNSDRPSRSLESLECKAGRRRWPFLRRDRCSLCKRHPHSSRSGLCCLLPWPSNFGPWGNP